MADDSGLDLVTGAFGNVGAAIARRLLADGRRVRTLTHRQPDATEGPPIEVRAYAFDDPDELTASFAGVATFYNTYWVRTGEAGAYGGVVARSRALLAAAERAGVQRIVQLSVAHPSLDSPYPYFRGKAQVEQALAATGVPAAVVRPALIFGGDSVLLHHLAWMLRRLPVFAIAGDGRYRVRPVHVDDVARLCVSLGGDLEPAVVDAVGPQRPTYDDLVCFVRDAVGGRARLVHLPARAVLAGSKGLGALLRDDLLTAEELRSTMEGLADSDGPATGDVLLTAWLAEHGAELGRRYVSERARRRR